MDVKEKAVKWLNSQGVKSFKVFAKWVEKDLDEVKEDKERIILVLRPWFYLPWEYEELVDKILRRRGEWNDWKREYFENSALWYRATHKTKPVKVEVWMDAVEITIPKKALEV